jgi:lipoic acid synthetase
MRTHLRIAGIETVCENAKCPNITECYARGSLTVLLLGPVCTRSCAYCGISHGRPLPPDPAEPERVAHLLAEIQPERLVLTSVTRDDLTDGGAAHIARTIGAVRSSLPRTIVESLVPDFRGDTNAIDTVISSRPHLIAHNIETVRSLFPSIRPRAEYERSLALLSFAKSKGIRTKSGFMTGIGENRDELVETMLDLRNAGVDELSIGQYLRPDTASISVSRYYTPHEFDDLRAVALDLGFSEVHAGTFVRSSYRPSVVTSTILDAGKPSR